MVYYSQLKASISEFIDSQKSSNGDLMQPFFGRDYPFLSLFEQKYTFCKDTWRSTQDQHQP